MFAFNIGVSVLILILYLPPFNLPRWLATRPPAWIYPILCPAVMVYLQWGQYGMREGLSSWVYEVGIAVGVFLGLFAWYMRAKVAQGKTVAGKGVDLDL